MKVIPSMFSPSKNGDDTRLNLLVSYEAHESGYPREVSSWIKVRFVPSISYLLLAIAIGALIGAAGRQIERKARTSISAWLWSIVAANIGAIILEILGIVLVSLNTEFKVFGIVLDPFQFPQVLLMAVFVGLFGVNISELVKQVLKPGGDQQQNQTQANEQGGR